MAKDRLSNMEIELYNATRKFANELNRENRKQIYFTKMEDQSENGARFTIIRLESRGLLRTYGFARAIYSVSNYDEEDWHIKIEGPTVHTGPNNKREFHKIVKDYKEFIIKNIYGVKTRVK